MGQPAIKMSDEGRVSYPAQKQAERRRQRALVHVRVVHPIATPQLLRDPLVRAASPLKSTVTGTRVLVFAVTLHMVALVLFVILGRFMGDSSYEEPSTAVQVEINDVPEPPPLVEEEEPDEGPIEDDFEKLEDEEPPPATQEPPAEIEPVPTVPEETEPEPEAAAPRRVVGLSFESTVEGGSGPAFATGTSRMGKTQRRARDPQVAATNKNPNPASPKSASGTGIREQRAASHIPGQGGKLEKPSRATPMKPSFPATLRAQGIEGDVLVRVKISVTGAVTEAAVLKSSGHAAFDRAALQTARREKFNPATRNGSPIPFTLSYSYRFRIED